MCRIGTRISLRFARFRRKTEEEARCPEFNFKAIYPKSSTSQTDAAGATLAFWRRRCPTCSSCWRQPYTACLPPYTSYLLVGQVGAHIMTSVKIYRLELLEYGRLAMGFANVRAGTRVLTPPRPQTTWRTICRTRRSTPAARQARHR